MYLDKDEYLLDKIELQKLIIARNNATNQSMRMIAVEQSKYFQYIRDDVLNVKIVVSALLIWNLTLSGLVWYLLWLR